MFQKCVGKRFDGAVEFAKMADWRKRIWATGLWTGLWIMYMIGCCFDGSSLYPRDD